LKAGVPPAADGTRRKEAAMLGALLALVAFQLAGELVVRVLVLPLPGPVVGMVLLLGLLIVRGSVPEALHRTALGILQHLSLLFVPAGVGIVAVGPALVGESIAVAVCLVLSTVITIVATGQIVSRLGRWRAESTRTSAARFSRSLAQEGRRG